MLVAPIFILLITYYMMRSVVRDVPFYTWTDFRDTAYIAIWIASIGIAYQAGRQYGVVP